MSDTTKFIIIPADNSSVLGYINEFMEATKLGLATNFGFDEFDTKNNFQHKPQIILLIDTTAEIAPEDYILINNKTIYKLKGVDDRQSWNLHISNIPYCKIICSSDKKLTPNAFISESDLQEIVDCYNKNYKFPQWELEYSTSYDYAETPPHSEIVCRKPFTNFANEVVFKKPVQYMMNTEQKEFYCQKYNTGHQRICDTQCEVCKSNQPKCNDCGAPLNEGEAKTFTCCDQCWDKAFPPNKLSNKGCRDSVKWFSQRMEDKLKQNDHKGGWDNCSLQYLSMRLTQERKELTDAIESKDAKTIINECADIANFALMIADKFGNKYGK